MGWRRSGHSRCFGQAIEARALASPLWGPLLGTRGNRALAHTSAFQSPVSPSLALWDCAGFGRLCRQPDSSRGPGRADRALRKYRPGACACHWTNCPFPGKIGAIFAGRVSAVKASKRAMLARVVGAIQGSGDVITVHVLSRQEATPVDTDMHQAFEIGVLLGGEQERLCGQTVAKVEAGDVWLHAACEPHGWRVTGPPTRELIIQFAPEFLGEETLDGKPWLSVFAVPPERRPSVLSAGMREKVLGIADGVIGEAAGKPQGWRDGVRLRVLMLLLTLYRGLRAEDPASYPPDANTSDLARVLPAVELVRLHPDRRVSLGEAAATCQLSVTRFRLLFRRTMGVSFGQFALRNRLAHAAHLLLSTRLSVEAVAKEVGFVDGSHLQRIFRKHYGRTPRSSYAGDQPLQEPRTELSSLAD